jgi:hypothetical protein
MGTIKSHEDPEAWKLRDLLEDRVYERFVRIALGSLGETVNHPRHACPKEGPRGAVRRSRTKPDRGGHKNLAAESERQTKP